jgi:hypothetical protein
MLRNWALIWGDEPVVVDSNLISELHTLDLVAFAKSRMSEAASQTARTG